MEVSVASEKLSMVLKESRLEKGYSESELGDMLGLSHVSISHWEGGRRIPQDRQLRRLAEILELDLDELLDLAEAERCRQDLKRLERKYKGKFKSIMTE
jgi:transcriptional regulator with XRE-family HTH domain